MAKAATVRVLALDGTWETIGVDRAAGIWVENDVPEYDEWGPAKLAFDLKRQSSRPWPDIGAFTPVEYEVAGVLVFSGRVADTPSRDGADRVMNVQCEGGQFHLDDDLYDRAYVHTRLPDWRDVRSRIDVDLTKWPAAPFVDASNGAASMGWAKGADIAANTGVGVVIDMGPDPGRWVRRVVVSYDAVTFAGQAGIDFYCRGSIGPDALAVGTTSDAIAINGATSADVATLAGTFNADYRYITLFVYWNTAGGPSAVERRVRLKAVQLFTGTTYESGNASVLKASTVVNDALDRATLLLSSDRSGIQTTSFSLPEYAPTAPQTPRQAWSGVDAFHDWVKQIDVYRRPIYKPKPGTPILEIGSWSAGEFNDSSANSGDEIYNRALVTGQTPAGQPYSMFRGHGGPPYAPAAGASVPNPGFEVDTSSWTNAIGSVVRDTAAAQGSVASGRLVTEAAFPFEVMVTTTISGLIPGIRYRVLLGVNRIVSIASGPKLEVEMNDTWIRVGSYSDADCPIGSWVDLSVIFTAQRTSHLFRAHATGSSGGQSLMYVDNVRVESARTTLPDRRGFLRTKQLPIQAALPIGGVPEDLTAPALVGDTWLTGHKTTPFKGTRTLVGDGAIRDVLTGQNVGLHVLGLKTMELVRFSDHIDPDTGGVGRDGRMTKVKYNRAEGTAEITIDNSRASFEALMARMAVVTGGA